MIPQLDSLARGLPSPHQSDAWRAISCASTALKQHPLLSESCRHLESCLDSASLAAGQAVNEYRHVKGGIEMAARLQKIRGSLFEVTLEL